jgi:hypothetical protein
MTKQVKQYIEISDIIGVRFECKQCHTSVSYPLSERFNLGKLTDCPSCGATWVFDPLGPSIAQEIANATESLKTLAHVLGTEGKFNTQLRFTFELAPDSSASDHVASCRG